MPFNNLLLQNQLCHPLYSASNAVQRAYKRILKKWDITYPQYLILLALWEQNPQTVSSIGQMTYFDSGTITPLIQKLEVLDLIEVRVSDLDKRSRVVSLTKKGQNLKSKMHKVPEEMACLINLNQKEFEILKKMISQLHQSLVQAENNEL